MGAPDLLIAELATKAPLGDNEMVVTSCLAQRLPVTLGTRRIGLLLLTNRRLVYVGAFPKTILLDKALKDLVSVGTEKNVRVDKELRTVLKISYGKETELFDILQTPPSGVSVDSLVERIHNLRASELIGAQTTSITDFGWLKTALERGGVLVSVVKCPSCGAPLDLPSAGGSTKCKHCGNTVVVQQVVDIIEATGLPTSSST